MRAHTLVNQGIDIQHSSSREQLLEENCCALTKDQKRYNNRRKYLSTAYMNLKIALSSTTYATQLCRNPATHYTLLVSRRTSR
jgi:hypothetical protein